MNLTQRIELNAGGPGSGRHKEGGSATKDGETIRQRLTKMGYAQTMRIGGTTGHVRGDVNNPTLATVHDSGKWSITGPRDKNNNFGTWKGNDAASFQKHLSGK
jgi:hypothetical protein